MRIRYYEGEDIAVVSLREPGEDTRGEIEIYLRASERIDLDRLVFERIPDDAAGEGRPRGR